MFQSSWEECRARLSKDERHLGIGLFAARRLLSPYGVHVRLEDCGTGTLVTLEIPMRKEMRTG